VHHTTKYAAVSGLLFAGACGVCALGLAAAGEGFARNASAEAPVAEIATLERSADARPRSPLLGANPERVARELAARRSWVEVVDAVNMRQGPSSANAVIKVQLEGTTLRVASRDGSWVEVVEPETGETGWVFEDYVKPIAPASRRAEAGGTTIR
jgi:uncharacterized protein YgiM (DUF1202 family)